MTETEVKLALDPAYGPLLDGAPDGGGRNASRRA